MPKKRRTPKQRAASRRNLEKARQARALERDFGYREKLLKGGLSPTGKTRLLYHRTSREAAKSIMKQGFKAGKYADGQISFTTRRAVKDQLYRKYGKAVLTVKVPRKLAKPDKGINKRFEAFEVDEKALKGRKIRRLT